MTLHSARRRQGFDLIAKIVAAFDKRERLPDEVEPVINALRIFACHGSTEDKLQTFARVAELRGKQGRQHRMLPYRKFAKRLDERAHAVQKRERELIAHGMPARRAHGQAIRDVAEQVGCKVRTLQNDVRQHRDFLRGFLESMPQTIRALTSRSSR